MPPRKRRYPLFTAYGLAVDHAIVHRDTLEVLPLADAVLAAAAAAPVPEGQRRDLELAPGVAGHTITLRSSKVMRKPHKWGRKLAALSAAVQTTLDAHNATLLPGGAHPFYLPARDASPGAGMSAETRVLCDTLFGTRTHGWSNNQSLRLEVYFDKDEEFGRAHAAMRLLMPLIPALTAASPILEGRNTGFLDARLEARLHAHERIPELMGFLVPEAVFDPDEHDREILSPIAQALGPHDPQHLLDPQTMDARGATAQFDPGILSLHVIDAQESPNADLAVTEFIIAVLRAMVGGRWVSTYLQRAWGAEDLQAILLNTIKDADRAVIANRDYLIMFGLMKQEQMHAQKVWQHLFVEVYGDLSAGARAHIGHILEHGSLATRILARTGKRPSAEKIRAAYTELALCLARNGSFR